MNNIYVQWITNKGTERKIQFASVRDAQKFAEAKGAKRNAVVIIEK